MATSDTQNRCGDNRADDRTHDTADQWQSDDEAVRLLMALRHLELDGADAARARLVASARPDERAARMRLRGQVVAALVDALLPTDLAPIRWLLEQEIADLVAEGHGSSEALAGLVAALARFGDPDDALMIWRAASATPEAHATVDVEQLGRAGVDAVRHALLRLRDAGGDDADQALAWLEDGVTSGAFGDLPAYFAWSDERFGLHAAAPT